MTSYHYWSKQPLAGYPLLHLLRADDGMDHTPLFLDLISICIIDKNYFFLACVKARFLASIFFPRHIGGWPWWCLLLLEWISRFLWIDLLQNDSPLIQEPIFPTWLVIVNSEFWLKGKGSDLVCYLGGGNPGAAGDIEVGGGGGIGQSLYAAMPLLRLSFLAGITWFHSFLAWRLH